MIYLHLFLISCVVVYIVDISGFTESWRGLISEKMKVKNLRPLPPFDCGQCMVWWVTLAFVCLKRELSVYTIAACGGYSFLSNTIYQLMLFIREWMIFIFRHTPKR